MDRVDVHGLSVAYERVGQGPPLVLLHGILQDSRAWRRQLDGLADDFTVVAWDAPGCGYSSDPPETFRLSEYAECLAGFIDALELESPHVLGLSLGGTFALGLYERRPSLPRTLILASAYAGWAGSLPDEVVVQRLEGCLREADLPPEQFIPGWMPGLLTENAAAGLAEELMAMMSQFHPVGYRVMAHSMAEADLRNVLGEIDVPTLLLYGEKDKRSPLSVAHDLHARIPGSTLRVLPGIGHLGNAEAADQFNSEVRTFLKESHS